MKRIILLITIIAALTVTAKAQSIDTTVKTITACKIQPVKANITDSLNSTHLGIKLISDDLKETAVVYWQLIDSKGNKTIEGNYTVTGTEYSQWCRNGYDCNLWLFFIVGRFYKFTFIQ